jgi:hypothetical protein
MTIRNVFSTHSASGAPPSGANEQMTTPSTRVASTSSGCGSSRGSSSETRKMTSSTSQDGAIPHDKSEGGNAPSPDCFKVDTSCDLDLLLHQAQRRLMKSSSDSHSASTVAAKNTSPFKLANTDSDGSQAAKSSASVLPNIEDGHTIPHVIMEQAGFTIGVISRVTSIVRNQAYRQQERSDAQLSCATKQSTKRQKLSHSDEGCSFGTRAQASREHHATKLHACLTSDERVTSFVYIDVTDMHLVADRSADLDSAILLYNFGLLHQHMLTKNLTMAMRSSSMQNMTGDTTISRSVSAVPTRVLHMAPTHETYNTTIGSSSATSNRSLSTKPRCTTSVTTKESINVHIGCAIKLFRYAHEILIRYATGQVTSHPHSISTHGGDVVATPAAACGGVDVLTALLVDVMVLDSLHALYSCEGDTMKAGAVWLHMREVCECVVGEVYGESMNMMTPYTPQVHALTSPDVQTSAAPVPLTAGASDTGALEAGVGPSSMHNINVDVGDAPSTNEVGVVVANMGDGSVPWLERSAAMA